MASVSDGGKYEYSQNKKLIQRGFTALTYVGNLKAEEWTKHPSQAKVYKTKHGELRLLLDWTDELYGLSYEEQCELGKILEGKEKKLTCKDCKYYGDVNPDWLFPDDTNFSCQKNKENYKGHKPCIDGPFLPEEEKEEDRNVCIGKSHMNDVTTGTNSTQLGANVGVSGIGYAPTLGNTVAKGSDAVIWNRRDKEEVMKMWDGQYFVDNKVKGQKMRKLVKVVRVAVMGWLLYGVAQLCILVNPLVAKISHLIDPRSTANDPVGGNVFSWVIAVMAVGAIVAAYFALKALSSWFFNWLAGK